MNDLPPGFSAPSWSTNGLLGIVAVGRSLADFEFYSGF